MIHQDMERAGTESPGYQAVWAAAMELEGSRKPVLYAEWVVRLYR